MGDIEIVRAGAGDAVAASANADRVIKKPRAKMERILFPSERPAWHDHIIRVMQSRSNGPGHPSQPRHYGLASPCGYRKAGKAHLRRSVPSQQAARNAGIAIVCAGALRVFDQVFPDS